MAYRLIILVMATMPSFVRAVEKAEIINGCPDRFWRAEGPFGDVCLTFMGPKLPFDQARQNCKARGGNLIEIHNEVVDYAFTSLLNTPKLSGSNPMEPIPSKVWFGLKYDVEGKTWRWVSRNNRLEHPYLALTEQQQEENDMKMENKCMAWDKTMPHYAPIWRIVNCSDELDTLCVANTVTAKSHCPAYYVQHGAYCYKPMMKINNSALDGAKDCADEGNSTLISPRSKEEYETLRLFLDPQLPQPVWLGLKYTVSDGKWKWSDGKDFSNSSSYHLAKWGLPANPDKDMCVMVSMKNDSGLQWSAEPCDSKRGLVICSKKAMGAGEMWLMDQAAAAMSQSAKEKGPNLANGCPHGFARSGALCSLLILQPMSWTQAELACQIKGGILATPRPYDPNSALRLLPSGMKNLHIGLKYTIANKLWFWSDGTGFSPLTDGLMFIDWPRDREPTSDACVTWRYYNASMFGWTLGNCTTLGTALPFCYAKAKSTNGSKCPDGYAQEGNLCLMPILDMLYNSPVFAEPLCRAHGNGTVANVKTNRDFENFKEMSDGLINHLPVPVWIGLKYNAAEGTWKFSDGTQADITSAWMPWKTDPVEPIDSDMCVLMIKNPVGQSEWILEDCRARVGFVACSKRLADGDEPQPNLPNGNEENEKEWV